MANNRSRHSIGTFMSLVIAATVVSCSLQLPSQINILILGQSNAMYASTWERLSEVLASRSVGTYLIYGAQGGTRLVADPAEWLPPDGEAYLIAIELYRQYRPPLPEIDFILWHQGEGDASNLAADWEAQYSAGLTRLIDSLENDVFGDWQFISALVHKDHKASAEAIIGINSAIANHPKVDLAVSFDDLSLYDNVHFESPALVGEHWANAILELLSQKNR